MIRVIDNLIVSVAARVPRIRVFHLYYPTGDPIRVFDVAVSSGCFIRLYCKELDSTEWHFDSKF